MGGGRQGRTNRPLICVYLLGITAEKSAGSSGCMCVCSSRVVVFVPPIDGLVPFVRASVFLNVDVFVFQYFFYRSFRSLLNLEKKI